MCHSHRRGCTPTETTDVRCQRGNGIHRHAFRVSREEEESCTGVVEGEMCVGLVNESRDVVG